MTADVEGLIALPDALFVVRGERIAWASSGAARLLDCEIAELVGRPFADVLAPDELARLGTLASQRREGWHIPETSRVRFVRPRDGAEVPADVRFAAGESAGDLVLCARDAAELIRAEELLAELTRVSGSALDVYSLFDACAPIFLARGWTVAFSELVPGGSITRRVISDPADPVGVYGRTLLDRLVPLAATPILAEATRTRRPLFLDNVPTLLSGTIKNAVALARSMVEARVARSAWCPVVYDDRVTHLVAAAGADLSEYDFIALQIFAGRLGAILRKMKLREELVRRERLAALGEMAAVLAHEIRNPLAVIFNTVSAFRRQADGSQAQLLQILADEAGHLERLASDLLVWARPPTPDVQASELGPIVRESVRAARHNPDSLADVAVELELADPLPLVLMDAALLHRALVNLLTNAFQHAIAGGRVRVRAGVEDDALVLRISNDGPGIAAEDAGRIFDPFFTKRPRGTGLGLCVVKQLVENMGGRVELESPSDPICFAIRLPTSAG